MEESNNIKLTMSWTELFILGVFVSLACVHASTGSSIALQILMIGLVVRGSASLWGFWVCWGKALAYAQGFIANNPVSVYIIHMIYPLTWPAFASAFITLGVSIYVMQIDIATWSIAVVAMGPHIFRYFVYNRILKFIDNPSVQQLVQEEMKLIEDDAKRNAILQEELNKVMPEVVEAAKARWIAEGIFTEEMNEHNQPVKSDEKPEQTTISDD